MTHEAPPGFSEPCFDILAIGNAIVDVIAAADDAAIAATGVVKGSMRLTDAAGALATQAAMRAPRIFGGGSAANTAVGLALLGGRARFVGQIGPDDLGAGFVAEMAAGGVECLVPTCAAGTPTARCLILVSPDGQRTMQTFPGAAHRLGVDQIDAAAVRDAAILYLEGYLWDSPSARAAMEAAIGVARGAGRKVALTPSDIACIGRAHDRFRALVEAGHIDLLFLNEAELTALAGVEPLDAAAEALARFVPMLVVTQGPAGAFVLHDGRRSSAPAVEGATVVDTTGAGDLFAAGFLRGLTAGAAVADALALGNAAAAEVISRFGARPDAAIARLSPLYLGGAGDHRAGTIDTQGSGR